MEAILKALGLGDIPNDLQNVKTWMVATAAVQVLTLLLIIKKK